MKKFSTSCLLVSLFLFSCTTNPYLKQTDLPEKINYYTDDKKFDITPEWYWRLRPTPDSSENWELTIGYQFLNGKTGSGQVIGELIKNDYKFYIVKWKDYGYFFVKEQDYLFAQKYKKFLVPLNYGKNYVYSRYEEEDDYQLIAFYQDISLPYVGDLPAGLFSKVPRSGLSLLILPRVMFIYSLMYNNYTMSSYYSDLKNIIQVYNNGYTNQFIQFTPCPNLREFRNDDRVILIDYVALEQIGTKQYTNQNGMMFMGALYKTKYIILKWGKAFYALPCE